jgi:hypothetical protein
MGCAATLKPPPAPDDPRPVYLLDHGRHTSLLLTDREAKLWRYAYGEWRWYVGFERGPTRALGALFTPTQAALGRAALSGPAAADALQPQVGSVIEAILPFEAEAARVDALLAALDALFQAAPEAPRRSAELGLDVVPHPVPYTYRHNSNHAVAEWLVALGFELRGDPMWGRWRVEAR